MYFSAFQGAFDRFDQCILRARKAYEEYVAGGERHAHLDVKDMNRVSTRSLAVCPEGAWPRALIGDRGAESRVGAEFRNFLPSQVISAVEEKKGWLDDARSRQGKRAKTEAPAVFVHEIVGQCTARFFFEF